MLNQSLYHIFVALDVTYNICLCVDVTLSLRFPLLPPQRRLKYYDLTSALVAAWVYLGIRQ